MATHGWRLPRGTETKGLSIVRAANNGDALNAFALS
jgi:hypothetical protein